MYAALPELKPHVVTRSRHRSNRGFGVLLSAMLGFITMAVESIGTYLKSNQKKCIFDAVNAMRQDDAMARNKLQQYCNDFLMYGRYNVKTLDKVIDTVNSLHSHQTDLESVSETTKTGMVNDVLEAVSFSFDLKMYMSLVEEEHANQYHLLEVASMDLLRGIATLRAGRLPKELLPYTHLKSILLEVQTKVKKMYTDHQLAAYHISHYWNMKLVTFAVNREMHALVVSFPVFVKDYQKSSLAMFEIETVPVPIPDFSSIELTAILKSKFINHTLLLVMIIIYSCT